MRQEQRMDQQRAQEVQILIVDSLEVEECS